MIVIHDIRWEYSEMNFNGDVVNIISVMDMHTHTYTHTNPHTHTIYTYKCSSTIRMSHNGIHLQNEIDKINAKLSEALSWSY